MTRGLGRVFKRKRSKNWQIEYWFCGQQVRESSGSRREKVAADLLQAVEPILMHSWHMRDDPAHVTHDAGRLLVRRGLLPRTR